MSTPSISEIAATLRVQYGITSVRQMEQITTELLVNMPTEGAIGELSGDGDPTGVVVPQFDGQLFHDTTNDTYYRSTGTDASDWEVIGSGGGGYVNVQGAGDPSAVTPDASGQIYKDTGTGNLWRANSAALGDWTLELQNAKIKWLPKSIDITHASGFVTNYDNVVSLIDITNLTLEATSVQDAILIRSAKEIQTISLPNLTACVDFAELDIEQCDALISISAPVLTIVNGFGLTIASNNVLTSVDLTSLVTVPTSSLGVNGCPLLTSLSIPAFIPTNGKTYNFQNNAFDATTVNHILARFVAAAGYVTGTLNLQGGTNAAPSGQGIADKATLQGRGVTVNTN